MHTTGAEGPEPASAATEPPRTAPLHAPSCCSGSRGRATVGGRWGPSKPSHGPSPQARGSRPEARQRNLSSAHHFHKQTVGERNSGCTHCLPILPGGWWNHWKGQGHARSGAQAAPESTGFRESKARGHGQRGWETRAGIWGEEESWHPQAKHSPVVSESARCGQRRRCLCHSLPSTGPAEQRERPARTLLCCCGWNKGQLIS